MSSEGVQETIPFGTVNYVVLTIYLVAIFVVAASYVTRQKSTSDYFKAGGRIPGWAAGLSVFATTISSISYVSTPEQVYLTNWTYYWSQLMICLNSLITYAFFVPFYRMAKVTSAYEYLEIRFNIVIRLFASINFIVFHIGRSAIIAYLTALTLMPYMDIPREVVVVLIGVVCVIYTFLGGMEGVVWTDVVQTIILGGSIIAIAVTCIAKTEGGVSEIVSWIGENDKFLPSNNWSWSWTKDTYPTIIFGFFFQSLQQYTAAQDVIQRYIAVTDMKAARRSAIVVVLLTAFVGVWFYVVGSAMAVFFSQQADPFPENFHTGGILAYFIVTEMPVGVAGLMIAGIFAASQSSLSSSLNSISACVTSDFYQRFSKTKTKKQSLLCARVSLIISGVLVTACSFILVIIGQASVWNQFNALISLLGGPLAGVFSLGIFVPMANGPSCVIGTIASIAVTFPLTFATNLHFFWDAPVGFFTLLIVGTITAPLFKPSDPEMLKTMTYRGYRQRMKEDKSFDVDNVTVHTNVVNNNLDEEITKNKVVPFETELNNH